MVVVQPEDEGSKHWGILFFFNVEVKKTAKGLWEKLKSNYEEKSLVNKIFLR